MAAGGVHCPLADAFGVSPGPAGRSAAPVAAPARVAGAVDLCPPGGPRVNERPH
jgi:hypothetical protein